MKNSQRPESDRTESDRPTKQAKTETQHDDGQAPGDEVGVLALSLETTLGFGAVGNEVEVDDAPADEAGSDTAPLLEHVIAYLATSKDLVQTRAVCRAFREISDMSADAKIRKLIGDCVRPMVGQDFVGLLHGAERLQETVRAKLREWDDDAAQAAGIVDVGIPTLAIPPTRDSQWTYCWNIIVLIDIFDEDVQGCRVPVKVRVGDRITTGSGVVAGLPDGFFHPKVKANGVVDRKIMVSSLDPPLLSSIGQIISFLNEKKMNEKKLRNVRGTGENRLDSQSFDLISKELKGKLNRVYSNFVDYRLGEPLPTGLALRLALQEG